MLNLIPNMENFKLISPIQQQYMENKNICIVTQWKGSQLKINGRNIYGWMGHPGWDYRTYLPFKYIYEMKDGVMSVVKQNNIGFEKCHVPVRAMHKGTVISVANNYSRDYGYNVIVESDEVLIDGRICKVRTRHAHLSQTIKKAGDRVAARTIIGISGNTGISTASHLHSEHIAYWKIGNFYIPEEKWGSQIRLDPKDFLSDGIRYQDAYSAKFFQAPMEDPYLI